MMKIPGSSSIQSLIGGGRTEGVPLQGGASGGGDQGAIDKVMQMLQKQSASPLNLGGDDEGGPAAAPQGGLPGLPPGGPSGAPQGGLAGAGLQALEKGGSGVGLGGAGLQALGHGASGLAGGGLQAMGHGPAALLGGGGAGGGLGGLLSGGQGGGAGKPGGLKGVLSEASGKLWAVPGLSNVMKGAGDSKGGLGGMILGGIKGGLKTAFDAGMGGISGLLKGKNPVMAAVGAYKGALAGGSNTPDMVKKLLGKLPI